MTYEAVLQGIINYLNKEILSTMADWQAMLARIAISRVLTVKDGFKAAVTQNTFMQSMGIVSVSWRSSCLCSVSTPSLPRTWMSFANTSRR